jgi:uncharacterized protein
MPPIPVFPDLRKITLDDKQLFDDALKLVLSATSELTFTNFFIWRDCDRSLVTNIYDNICVLANPENESSYFFEPIGTNRVAETIRTCLTHAKRLSRVSESFYLKHLEKRMDIKAQLDKDNSDYVYLRQDLVELKGKKFDGKRNHINKFLKNNSPKYREMVLSDSDGCLCLLGKWQKAGRGICFDQPIREALSNFNKISIKGAVVELEGRIEAFTMGEKLNNDTAIVYIEVVNPDIDGIAQYINQQFCVNAWADVTYINREQDLGDAGLRRAKQSYKPVQMINKYDITML